MFVHLDLGWMSHPFALSSFKIADANQIATIRSLGLARVRWSPEQSDPAVVEPRPAPARAAAPAAPAAPPEVPADTVTRAAIAERSRVERQAAAAQRAAAQLVQRQYAEAARDWRGASDLALKEPQVAGQRLGALTRALVEKMLAARELSIRAVSAMPGDRATHPLNVGVISLLMGRLCGMSEADLIDLGVGALTHDLGKLELPSNLHRHDEHWTSAEIARYRDHVALGVALGKRMGLSPGALLVVGQHHEHCDGSGFPQGVDANRMSVAARVVALVNRYDNLCHPAQAARAMSPHEALSLLYAQGQKRYDPAILNTFVRMMGVYPPGSVVQLTDDRYALVMSVNSSRPLKPNVLVHDAQLPREEALQLNLMSLPDLGIRRSLKPSQLPADVLAYLAPRPRVAYFFEAARIHTAPEEDAVPA